MKILVTGGAGFIGSNLVDRLVDEGHSVVVIDNLSTGKLENIHKEARFYEKEICSSEITDIFKKELFDFVYHEAAQIDVQKSISDPMFDGDVNILGTINILKACIESNVKKIIYASSAAVYGEPQYLGIDENHPVRPISYYGISKYTPENYIETFSKIFNIDYTILRYANVYGIRQDPKGEGGVISIFIDKLFKGESPTIFGDGCATRDFIYVDDVIEANIKALNRGSRKVFNIGTGKAISVKELFDIMKEIMKSDLEVQHREVRKGDIRHSFFDVKSAKEALGWAPKYRVEEGLNKTIQYYQGRTMSKQINEVAASVECG
jgi:UDP-glucose 4-epimerase